MLKKSTKISVEDFNKIADEVREKMYANDKDVDITIKIIIDLTIAKIATIMFTK